MNQPIVVEANGFQEAYVSALRELRSRHWSAWNLVVQVSDVGSFDHDMHRRVSALAEENGLLSPRQVAYTIFPQGMYKGPGSRSRLYQAYLEHMLPRVRRSHRRGWGTYFERMIAYSQRGAPEHSVNQLEEVISSISRTPHCYGAAYTIVIPRPGSETRKLMGSPCLSYIAVQLEPAETPALSLLAVYRNHDFFKRAYGNYWGLCNLLSFMASETGFRPGTLTCISSHAFVDKGKTALLALLSEPA